jgi:hypothetical protein
MEEKVIHEVRVIETEDGYRIEIKGNKEQIKAFMERRGFFGKGMGPMGPGGSFGFMRRHHGPRGHHGHHGPKGPWGRGGPFRGFGPWGWNEEEEQETSQRGPAADKGPDSARA